MYLSFLSCVKIESIAVDINIALVVLISPTSASALIGANFCNNPNDISGVNAITKSLLSVKKVLNKEIPNNISLFKSNEIVFSLISSHFYTN